MSPPSIAELSDPLAAPLPAPPLRRARWWWLGGLLAAALLPRLAMAWRVDVIVLDAIFHIGIAEHLQAGRFDQAFQDLHLNLYPIVLALLHGLGLSWQQ